MLYVLAKDNGEVVAISTIQGEGYKPYDGTFPPCPIVEDDTEPRLALVNGELIWQTGKTAEELADERRQAYEAEADRYLIAMHGYEVEGNTAAAENCRQAYLAKKREIRARIS